MRKRFNILLLGVALVLFVSACSDPKPAEKKKPTAQSTTEQQTSDVKSTPTPKEREDTITYHDDKYGFSMRLPAAWQDKYTTVPGDWDDKAEAIIDFNYESTDTNLFSIIVLNMTKAEWDRDYAGGLWGYLGEKDGKIFAYTVPSELPAELQTDKQKKVDGLVDVTQMINIDVPRIVKTFAFTK